jgi:hypothetical protein
MYVLPPGRYTLLDGLYDMMKIVRKSYKEQTKSL